MSFSSSNNRNIHRHILLLFIYFFFFTGFLVDVVEGEAATTALTDDVNDDGPNPTLLYKFTVQINSTSVGSFNFKLMPEWAPIGVKRFEELVNSTGATTTNNPNDITPFFNDIRIFRVLKGQIAQFGINGNTDISKYWRIRYIKDDPVIGSNRRGTISYAHAGPNTRTTQFFINLHYNIQYDSQGFAPIGYIEEEDMEIVDQLYSGYGDSQPRGNGPIQSKIHTEGNSYLQSDFPLLSYILSVERTYEEQSSSNEEDADDEDNNNTSGGSSTTYTTSYGVYHCWILSTISFVVLLSLSSFIN